jgi:peptidyl-prolyl cis-trans isomerase C
MIRMTKRLVLPLVVVGLATGQALAADSATTPPPAAKTTKSDDLFGSTVVVKGKGVEIKRGQLDDEVIRVKSQIAASGRPIPPEQASMMERQILDQMIALQLLQSKATEADKAAAKETAEKRFADAKKKLGSEEALNRQLKVMGTSREEVLAKWTEALTAENAAKRELKVNITDADAKKYYDDNPARFEKPEMVRASHILLMTIDPATRSELADDKKAAKRKQMDDLLKRARGGEDFAKMAKEYSEDPGSKDRGGEYTFPRGQMDPAFEAAAFALKTNEVSDVITSSYGYHIIKLSEKIPAQKITFAEASNDLKDGLAQQAMQKEIPDYIQKLRKEAGVEILDEKLKKLESAEMPGMPGMPAGHPPVTSGNKPTSK